MTTIEKPRCPDARRKWQHETDTCDLNDKMCLLESNTECQIYEDFLAKCDALFDAQIERRLLGRYPAKGE